MSSSYFRSFAKDNAIVIVGHLFFYTYGIVLMPLVIKTVGATVYGGFVLLSSILSFIIGISSFGVGFKAKRYLPSAREMTERRDLFNQQFLFSLVSISLLSFILVFVNSQLNVYLFKNEVSYSAAIIPIFLISYYLYSQGTDYFRYTSRIKYMTIANICFPYCYIGLVLVFFYLFDFRSINGLVLAQAISAALIAAFCFRIILREIGKKVKPFNKKDILSDIRLGIPLVLNFVVDYVLSGVGRYFIAYYISVTAVGYFNPAYVLGSMIIILPKAMGTVIPQLLSKAVDNNDVYEAQRIVNYSVRIFLLVAIPFIFGSMVLGKQLLVVLANSEVASSAYLIVPIVALGATFYGLNITLSNVLFVKLRTPAMFKMNIFAAIFNLLGNLVILYFYRSIVVVAFAMLLSYFLVFMYIRWVVAKDWVIDYNPRCILKSIVAGALMGAILHAMSSHYGMDGSLLVLVLEVVIGTVIYLGSLIIMRAFSSEEIVFLKRAFA